MRTLLALLLTLAALVGIGLFLGLLIVFPTEFMAVLLGILWSAGAIVLISCLYRWAYRAVDKIERRWRG